VNDFPGHSQLSSYADNFHLFASSPDLETLGRELTDQLKLVSEWASEKRLKIEPSKSHVTLFMLWTKEANKHPAVYLDGTLLALKKNPKQLRINWSLLNASSVHVDAIMP
jgi:hypothetical protein